MSPPTRMKIEQRQIVGNETWHLASASIAARPDAGAPPSSPNLRPRPGRPRPGRRLAVFAEIPGLQRLAASLAIAAREVAADAYRSAASHATGKRRWFAINRRNIAAITETRAQTASQAQALTVNRALEVARETGLEPATSGVTGRRSNQLSYSPARLGPITAPRPPSQAGFKDVARPAASASSPAG